VLILDLSDVPLLGVTASLAIETMVKEACDKGREVFIVGATGKVKTRLQRLEVMDMLPLRNRINDRTEALRQAIIILDGHQLQAASSGMGSGNQ
jgi:SulP family sulfate permease